MAFPCPTYRLGFLGLLESEGFDSVCRRLSAAAAAHRQPFPPIRGWCGMDLFLGNRAVVVFTLPAGVHRLCMFHFRGGRLRRAH